MVSEKGQSRKGIFLLGRRSRRGEGGVAGTKGRYEGSEVGAGVGILLV